MPNHTQEAFNYEHIISISTAFKTKFVINPQIKNFVLKMKSVDKQNKQKQKSVPWIQSGTISYLAWMKKTACDFHWEKSSETNWHKSISLAKKNYTSFLFPLVWVIVITTKSISLDPLQIHLHPICLTRCCATKYI